MAKATDEFLAVIHPMLLTFRLFTRPDGRTEPYFESTRDELMQAVYAFKPYLPPEQQDTLLEIWEEYVCTPLQDLAPALHAPDDYPEDKLQTLLERFRKLTA